MNRTGAILLVGAGGAGALALASILTTPGETTLLQAALSARDYRSASDHSATAEGSGGFALALRALVGSGRTQGALDRVDAQIAATPHDMALWRTRADLLGRLGRTRDQAVMLDRIARTSGRVGDLRAAAAIAERRDDLPMERAMLTALATGGHARTDARLRLAWLDMQAGDPATARTRLTTLLDDGAHLPPDAAQRLVALTIDTGDAAAIDGLVTRLRAAGPGVPDDAAIVARLAATGRTHVARAYADRAAPRDPSALLALRIALLQGAGDPAAARALLDTAIATPAVRILPADIVRMAYELDHIPAIIAGVVTARIRRVPAPMALDLARRALAADRPDWIPAIDRIAPADWRTADPWTALQLARRTNDQAAVLRYAALLPADRVRGVAEAALGAQGDRAGLRRLLLTEPQTAEGRAARLDQAGFRDDADRVLRDAAATARADDPATRRLLYRWGPRPTASALDWLRMRAATARDPAGRLAWLRLYAARDRPDRALATLAREPDGDTRPLLLLRLATARDAGEDATAGRVALRLLDMPALTGADLQSVAAALPDGADAGDRARLADRMVAAGIAPVQLRRDMAYAALRARRIDVARGHAAAALAAMPDDIDTLMLAGEIEQAAAATPAARGFFTRALAATPVRPQTIPARAALLERLGRPAEALALVRTAPVPLRALEARLLIATGRPAAAATLLADGR